jgi:hypothetical protein
MRSDWDLDPLWSDPLPRKEVLKVPRAPWVYEGLSYRGFTKADWYNVAFDSDVILSERHKVETGKGLEVKVLKARDPIADGIIHMIKMGL